MDEKLKFVSRYLDGEKITTLCQEFGISRVTSHKIIEHSKDSGLEAFTDRSRRPFRQATRLPFQVEQLIVNLKKELPTWGAPKLRDRIHTHCPKLTGTNLSDLKEPNAPWCVDYKHVSGTYLDIAGGPTRT